MYKAVLKAYMGVDVVETVPLCEHSDRLRVEQYIETAAKRPSIRGQVAQLKKKHPDALVIVAMTYPEKP
jgi:hypothetical protein